MTSTRPKKKSRHTYKATPDEPTPCKLCHDAIPLSYDDAPPGLPIEIWSTIFHTIDEPVAMAQLMATCRGFRHAGIHDPIWRRFWRYCFGHINTCPVAPHRNDITCGHYNRWILHQGPCEPTRGDRSMLWAYGYCADHTHYPEVMVVPHDRLKTTSYYNLFHTQANKRRDKAREKLQNMINNELKKLVRYKQATQMKRMERIEIVQNFFEMNQIMHAFAHMQYMIRNQNYECPKHVSLSNIYAYRRGIRDLYTYCSTWRKRDATIGMAYQCVDPDSALDSPVHVLTTAYWYSVSTSMDKTKFMPCFSDIGSPRIEVQAIINRAKRIAKLPFHKRPAPNKERNWTRHVSVYSPRVDPIRWRNGKDSDMIMAPPVIRKSRKLYGRAVMYNIENPPYRVFPVGRPVDQDPKSYEDPNIYTESYFGSFQHNCGSPDFIHIAIGPWCAEHNMVK